MKIVALSKKGAEFMYDPTTAHKVPQTKAKEYADDLNACGYMVTDTAVWYVHDIDRYDMAYTYALCQEFYTYKHTLKEKKVDWGW